MNYSLVHHFVINLMQSGNLLLYTPYSRLSNARRHDDQCGFPFPVRSENT